jgi:molybdopterin molybdotransferase
LAQPVLAPHDLPLFDNSAVDGFGVKVSDIASATPDEPIRLKNMGTVQAGDASSLKLTAGSAVKILTGAPVPGGVEAIIMQELTAAENGHVDVQTSAKVGEHIRWRGEEFKRGDTVLPANVRVTPPVVGLLASLGYASATIFKRPTVAVVVTGNELVQPGAPLPPGHIYESNSHSLVAALRALGCDPVAVYQAQDSLESVFETMTRALDGADILITTGGVSVGEFDWVKDAAKRLKIQPHFWKVAIKPGKPVFFGTRDNGQRRQLVFGLPGNPVAVLLTFYLFVRPALQAMQGLAPAPALLPKARLVSGLRKKPGRLDFVRAKLGRDEVGMTALPASRQGSHMLGGLAVADCLIPFEREESAMPEGSWTEVIPLDWSDL